MSRLFVAIDVPEAVRASLGATKLPIETARWVPEDQLHLTLRFIGDAEAPLEAAIIAELAKIEATAFEIAIDGVGQFPKNRPARILWAGTKPVEPLHELAKRVDEAVTAAGVAPLDKPFSPHFTLA